MARRFGDGELLAQATGIDVVYDFEAADLAAGGHGAPMAPVYYRILADQAGLARPLAVIMISGATNVTYIGEDGTLAAFDVVPAATAEAIAHCRERLPGAPRMWLLVEAVARVTRR